MEDLTAKCISSEQLLEAELRKFQEMQENHVARETNERSRFTDIVNAKDLELEQLKQQLRELQMQSELNKTAETRQLSAENMDLRRSIADLQGALRGAQLENEEAHVQVCDMHLLIFFLLCDRDSWCYRDEQKKKC